MRCDCSSRQAKLLLGAFISLTTAVTWVSFTQLLKNLSEKKSFDAPFTLTYFLSVWIVFPFPGYLLVNCLARLRSARDILSDGLHVYKGGEHFQKLQFLWKSLLFCIISGLTLYTYIRALYKLSAADCTALYAANHSFVYLLSWIVLYEKFVAMRIFAMIFSITGIVLFAYVDGFGSPAMFGVVMAVASSSGAAVYAVLYKKFIGEVTSAQASFFITLTGSLSLILLWPLPLLLHMVGVEQVDWSHLPWELLIPSALLYSVFWCVREWAVLAADTLCCGLGLALAIPLCAVADTMWKGREFSGMKIAALVLITVGLLLILLPEDWHSAVCQRMRSKRQDKEEQTIGQTTTLRGRLSRTSYM